MSSRPLHNAARAFETVPVRYERGRPGYPPGIIATILGAIPPGALVVDPSPAMLRQLPPDAGLVVAAVAPAEHLPVAPESIDAICVAHAFHWFNGPVAVAELARVMRPGAPLSSCGTSAAPSTPRMLP